MTLIEQSKFFGKIEEKNYAEYLKLVSESQERQIDIDHVNAADSVMALKNAIAQADKTISMMDFLLDEYAGVATSVEGKYQKWFVMLMTAAYLHHIYFVKQSQFASIMYPRQFTEHLAKQAKIPSSEFEMLLQSVESVLGVNGPQKLKAAPNTPGEILVLAITLVENEEKVSAVLQGE